MRPLFGRARGGKERLCDMKLSWYFSEPLESPDLIREFEAAEAYLFPADFVKCVRAHNGGYPSAGTFDTAETEERELKSLLSFNRDAENSVWERTSRLRGTFGDRYLPFAEDDFGNPVCFLREDGSVVFVDLRTGAEEQAAESFAEFLEGLYE